MSLHAYVQACWRCDGHSQKAVSDVDSSTEIVDALFHVVANVSALGIGPTEVTIGHELKCAQQSALNFGCVIARQLNANIVGVNRPNGRRSIVQPDDGARRDLGHLHANDYGLKDVVERLGTPHVGVGRVQHHGFDVADVKAPS